MKEYNKKIIIIAEAGVNHNGSLSTAKKLINAAKNSGADIVKFQNFNTDELASKNLKKPKYTKNNSFLKNMSQYELLKSLELSDDKIKKLNNYAKSKKIEFLSTPFDLGSR